MGGWWGRSGCARAMSHRRGFLFSHTTRTYYTYSTRRWGKKRVGRKKKGGDATSGLVTRLLSTPLSGRRVGGGASRPPVFKSRSRLFEIQNLAKIIQTTVQKSRVIIQNQTLKNKKLFQEDWLGCKSCHHDMGILE